MGLLAAECLNPQQDKQEEQWSSFRRIPRNGVSKLHHNRIPRMAWAAHRACLIDFHWFLDWILSYWNMDA